MFIPKNDRLDFSLWANMSKLGSLSLTSNREQLLGSTFCSNDAAQVLNVGY